MDALVLALIVIALALPFHIAMQWHLTDLEQVRRMHRAAVALAREEELEARSEIIGTYDGHAIYAWVQFMGTRYRFEGVAPRAQPRTPTTDTLFLEPGLLYLAEA